MRTKNKIEDGNMLLAEFMGGLITHSETYEMPHGSRSTGTIYHWSGITGAPESSMASIGIFSYHSDWAWLWPVIDRIESLGFNFSISRRGIQVTKWRARGRFEATDLIIDNDFSEDYIGREKLIAVWDAAVSFVKWYSKQHSDK